MFKIFKFIFLCVNICFSQNCFKDVSEKGLVSYQNKVYNIKNYKHPGGQDTLILSVGKPLEDFFNLNNYKFHITSNLVKKDLETLYIGNLCNIIQLQQTYDTNYLFLYITLSLFLFSCLINYTWNYTWNYSCSLLLFYFLYISWWITLLILSIYYKDGILKNLGIWICYNISFTLLPITKNSVWNKFLKISYTKLLTIHKTISILCLLSVITKIIVILILYNYKYLYKNIINIAGLISSISIILTAILATPPIRKYYYEIFYYSHKILSIITIISISFHYIICLYYILFPIVLYLIDIIIRRIKTKKAIYTKVTVYEFKDTSYIFILLSVLNTIPIIEPGSYFYLCCDKISFLEWHPLSLISQDNNNNLIFCVKNMGKNSWSFNLKKLQNSIYLFDNHHTFLQGPYNHLNIKYHKYDYIINIANGIGVTPFFSILKHINRNFTYKKVIFIWIIPNINFFKPFYKYFNNLDNIDMEIYLTQDNQEEEEKYIEFNIYKFKPNIKNYIKKFIENKNTKNISIISCGSESLINDINIISSSYSIDFFNETFQ